MKSRKQKSKSIPDWVFFTKYDFSDIKNFLEVDKDYDKNVKQADKW